MSVILINPNNHETTDVGEGILPPLGLCYINAYLKNKNVDCQIIDANALNLTDEECVRLVCSKDPTIVGITSTTPLILQAYKLARLFKKFHPGIHIVLGGPHPSVLPKRTLQECESIDTIIHGEGEITMYELFLAITKNSGLKNVTGITTRLGNEIIETGPRSIILDLDSLPFPDRSDLPMKIYKPSVKWYNRTPFATIMTSRGCPNDCIFCASKFILGRSVRFRTPENVIMEITELISKYGIKEIMFYDDTFTLNQNHVTNICNLIIENKIDITWGCLSRVDRVDEAILKLMKKAGCHIMSFGIESGSVEILKTMRKNITKDQVREAIRLCKKIGIDTSASFVFGVPGETEKTIEETISFAIEVDPLYAQFYRVVPFPGTDLFPLYEKQLDGQPIRWQSFLEVGDTGALLKIESIDTNAFDRLLKKSYRKFYLRPKKIFILIIKMFRPYKLLGLITAFTAFIKLLTTKRHVEENNH